MKKYTLLFVALLVTAFSLFAQSESVRYMNVYSNGEIVYQQPVTQIDSVTFPLFSSTPELGDTLTVANLIQMKEDGTLPSKDAGTEKYWVKGYIVGVYDYDTPEKFVLTGTTTVETNLLLADNAETTDTYSVASVKLAAGLFRDALNLAAHPENYKKELKLYGVVEKYCGIGGVVKIEEAYLDGVLIKEQEPNVDNIDYLDGELSVTNFLALPEIVNLASGATTEAEYTVRGIVKEVKNVSLMYGNAQFYITDGTNDLLCYNIFALNGDKFVSKQQLEVGDIVTVKSVVTNYNGTIEPKGGYITRTTNTFDPSSVDDTPKTVTVADVLAMNIASGETADGLYQIIGTVATIKDAFSAQYGNATFTITDSSSAEELTIYRAKYLENKKWTEDDPQIQVGDVVTVIGSIKNYNGTIEFVDCNLSAHN